MECGVAEEGKDTEENENLYYAESTEKFQKFMYDLFEKNGVLSDLRAYLRSHIVQVLKSVQTGDSPLCQRNFTQRLQLNYQAVNLLILEYLLQMEFSYSLSVFMSEIPLGNMVFSFTKALMKNGSETNIKNIAMNDNDVWSVLNYLGVQCDSNYAMSILNSYRNNDQNSLLMCILQSLQKSWNDANESELDKSSATSSLKSSNTSCDDSIHKRTNKRTRKCKHYASCKACKRKISKLTNKYNEKKKQFQQMFAQLSTVYESELEVMKADEQKRIKNSILAHVVELKKRTAEMEDKFRAREEELENNIREKKKFLWGLAQSLREQHAHMARAMATVREESRRLTDKEQNLKKQLLEAEETLKKRGEDMKGQITNELTILESHLNELKKERDSITKERDELEKLRTVCESQNTVKVSEVMNEMSSLKKYLEVSKLEPKVVTEKGTITDIKGVASKLNVLNNEMQGRSLTRITSAQLVNDLKKQKNVNFDLSATELSNDRTYAVSNSSCTRDMANDSLHALTEQNEKLRLVAKQQREEIAVLSSRQKCLMSELMSRRYETRRPFTAPVTQRYEEPQCLSVRGHLLKQWRELRNMSPEHLEKSISPARRDKSRERSANASSVHDSFNMAGNEVSQEPEDFVHSCSPTEQHSFQTPRTRVVREKSPNTILREAKEKLKNKIYKNPVSLSRSRDKSPSSVLKEAKMRLRKLEIEAEAVERSYLDYRRRQSEKKGDSVRREEVVFSGDILSSEIKTLPNTKNVEEPIKQTKITNDFEKYLKDYETKYNLKDKFQTRTYTERIVKPIPVVYSENAKKNDLIDTPLSEFRKLYNSQNTNEPRVIENISETAIVEEKPTVDSKNIEEKPAYKYINKDVAKEIETRKVEYEILVENANKIYSVEPNSFDNVTSMGNDIKKDETMQSVPKDEPEPRNQPMENLLTVEVENLKEKSSLLIGDSSDNCVYFEIESSVDGKEIGKASDSSNSDVPPPIRVVISPKCDKETIDSRKSNNETIDVSPKSNKEVTDISPKNIDNSVEELFQSENQINDSNLELISNDSKVKSDSEGKEYDYPDDFSADVDNYNSNLASPISGPKISDDENFWES